MKRSTFLPKALQGHKNITMWRKPIVKEEPYTKALQGHKNITMWRKPIVKEKPYTKAPKGHKNITMWREPIVSRWRKSIVSEERKPIVSRWRKPIVSEEREPISGAGSILSILLSTAPKGRKTTHDGPKPIVSSWLKPIAYGLCLIAASILNISGYAQNVGISATGTPPDNSAMLDVDVSGLPSNNKKGLLIPRMTTAERNALPSPANSLLIFNTTTQCFESYNGSAWVTVTCVGGCSAPGAPTGLQLDTNTIWSPGVVAPYLGSEFTISFSVVAGATSYELDVAYDNTFTKIVPGYNGIDIGNVTSYRLTDLRCQTGYYIRVRAKNTCGKSGNSGVLQVSTYRCRPACGYQEWMATNMNVGTMVMDNNTGVWHSDQNNDMVVEKYCYNNVAANCATYGGLYEWTEAVQVSVSFSNAVVGGAWQSCDPCGSSGRQGICPSGYHIPTDLEFSRYEWCVETTISPTGSTPLSTFQTTTGWRGTNSAAGPGHKMKVTSSNTPSWDGSNASGFSALPAGHRDYGGGFILLGSNALFWTATDSSAAYAWYHSMYTVHFQGARNYPYKTDGLSVRCLQN